MLVLDEPTAVLTPQETEEIFAVLRRLADEGHSIIFISHKLYEVLEIADRITVIRRGRVVGERIPAETDEDDLAELMVGRDVQLVVDRGESHPAEVMLRVEGLRVNDDRGSEVVRDVDLEVRAGEILGIAGVAGNGQDELVEAIDRPAPAGRGIGDPRRRRPSRGRPPRDMNEAGVGYVPADRHRFGLILSFPVTDNLVLTDYHRPPYARGFLRRRGRHRRRPLNAASRSTTSGRRRRRSPPGRCPVAISRRSSSHANSARTSGCSSSTSRRAASTSAASSSSIARRSRSGMPERPSCSSRRSSTRSGAVRPHRGHVSRCDRRDARRRTADKNEIGLLMATGGREQPDRDRHRAEATA